MGKERLTDRLGRDLALGDRVMMVNANSNSDAPAPATILAWSLPSILICFDEPIGWGHRKGFWYVAPEELERIDDG